jgi:tetratricopeptide (TPR) repeat protein
MSSIQIKSNLKAARESIAKKDYGKALELSRKVLSFEPGNYNAHVFTGISLLNLSQYADSEKSYREATSLNSTNPLAWQGLVNLYEKQGNLSGLKEATLALADIYFQRQVSCRCLANYSNDEEKCFGVIDKYVTLVKSKGSQAQVLIYHIFLFWQQINDALALLLPDTSYFTLIERHLPSPGETCQQIASSLEKMEQEAIDKEIAKRRIRLGANLEQVTRDVKREVLSKSEVSKFTYEAHLSLTIHTKKWLIGVTTLKLVEFMSLNCLAMRGRHCWFVFQRKKVWEETQSGGLLMEWLCLIFLTNLHGPFLLIGKTLKSSVPSIHLHIGDKLEMYGKMFIQDLIRAIPQSGLAKVLSAYLQSELSGFPPDSPEENGDPEVEQKPNIPTDEILDDMIVYNLLRIR